MWNWNKERLPIMGSHNWQWRQCLLHEGFLRNFQFVIAILMERTGKSLMKHEADPLSTQHKQEENVPAPRITSCLYLPRTYRLLHVVPHLKPRVSSMPGKNSTSWWHHCPPNLFVAHFEGLISQSVWAFKYVILGNLKFRCEVFLVGS